MSKKYILNKTNAILLLQDSKLQTVVKLQPKQCSFQAFDETDLLASPYIYRAFSKGVIELLDQRVTVVKKVQAKNYGQKYKIGTTGYLNDKNNIDITVDSFDPNTNLYTVTLTRTGGKIKVEEQSITLKKNIGDKVSIDINEEGDLVDTNRANDLSLPQEPEEVQIVRAHDRNETNITDAKTIISNQNNIADEISNQKVDIVYKNEKEENPVEEEETFIIKTDKGFAKEISASEMVKNTQKAINDKFAEIIDSTKVIKAEKEEGIKEENFFKLSTELQEFISNFLHKDNRSKKLIISRLKDIDKLTAIKDCADEVSSKAAKAKLDKING